MTKALVINSGIEREIGLAAPSEMSLAAESDKRRLYLQVKVTIPPVV